MQVTVSLHCCPLIGPASKGEPADTRSHGVTITDPGVGYLTYSRVLSLCLTNVLRYLHPGPWLFHLWVTIGLSP